MAMHFFQALHYRTEKPKQLPFLDCTDAFLDADAEYILNYTSNVIKITKDGNRYFFKESKVRPKSLYDVVYGGIESFFDEIVHNTSLRERTLDALKCKNNLRRIVNMGCKDREGDLFHRYLVTDDGSCLGLPSPVSEAEKGELKKLVFYLYGELQNWFYNINVKKGQLQTYSAVRALGTQELARMLGIDSLIPRCGFVKLKLMGRVRYGILSEEAEGDTLTSSPFAERAGSVTPTLLRDLTNLNLLDALTGDNDHRIGNYHVVKNGTGEYSALISYDNDSPDTFKLSSSVHRPNLIGCSPLVDRGGIINRAHLDGDTVYRLTEIKKTDLNALLPYLGRMQISFVMARIRKVRKAILKTARVRSQLLIPRTDWKKEHIKEDLSPKYGKTYLASLLSDCYFETGFHEFDTLN